MFSSHILSRLLRIGLLGVFVVGLFVSIGEVSINQGGTLSLSQGGISTVAAAEPAGGAVTPGANDKKAEPVNAAIDGLIDVYNMGIELLSIIITPLIMLAGWLLSPDWTFGDIFGLRPILHQLWIFVSNIVYVIFGFILVSIAFANIFGAGGAEYEMKKMLPKLVTGIVIVPFTWFIVSAVLSLSNILTASVIQLPVDTINQASSAKIKEFFGSKKIIPKNMIVDLTGDGEGGKMKDQMDCSKDEEKCITISELLSDANGGAYNLLTAYAYGIFNIDRYKDITKNQIEKGSVKKVGDILRKIGLGIIFFIVFGVLVIAIVYALLTRAMMLWMFAIFSPLFALNFVIGGGKSKALEKLGKLDIKHFISLAMVPVYVSAALSFGLMFLSLVMNPPVDGSAKRTSVDGKQTFTMGQITLTTIGDPNMMDNLGTGFQTGQGIVSTIILGFLALAILWMAVMAALSADEITGHAVEPIANFGKSVGELAVKAPQYIPLKLPGMDKGISMHGLGQAGGTIASNIQTASGKTGQDFADKIFGKNELTNASREAITTLNSVGKEGVKNARAFEALQKVLKTGGNPKELSQNGTAREMIAAAAASLDIKDLGDISNEASMAKAIGRIDKTLKPFGKDLMPSLDTNTATPEQIKTGIANMHIQNVSNYNVEKVNIPDGQDVGTIIVNDTANKKKINVPITIKDSNLNTDSFTKALIDNGIKDSTEQQNIINNVNEWLEKKKTTPTAPEKPKS